MPAYVLRTFANVNAHASPLHSGGEATASVNEVNRFLRGLGAKAEPVPGSSDRLRITPIKPNPQTDRSIVEGAVSALVSARLARRDQHGSPYRKVTIVPTIPKASVIRRALSDYAKDKR